MQPFDWALSQSPSGALSVYGPYDWIEMRFMAVIIIASVFSLPFFSHLFFCLIFIAFIAFSSFFLLPPFKRMP